MKKLHLITLCLLTLVITTNVYAQATRTWVSGVGDDANPCSRTAPCKTFAGAISKTAAGGEINVIDPGGFGAVTITKSITIDGGGGQTASVLVSGTNGIVISAASTDVITLRNLDLTGLGNYAATTSLDGVKVLAAKAVHVENCVINGFTNGIDVVTNVPSTFIGVRNTVIRNNRNGGLKVLPSVGGNVVLSVSESHFDENGFAGMHLTNDTRGVVDQSTFNQNSAAGVIAESASVDVGLTHCTLSGNTYGISAGAASAAVVRIAECLITGNGFGVSTGNGAAVISFGNNAVAGNMSGGNSPSFSVGSQ